MKKNQTSAYTFFEELATSGEFLNFLLNNINSCVLLLDRNMRLQAFNNTLKTIFVNRDDEHLMFQLCGEALGCAYQADELKNCGETTHCKTCELRITAMKSYCTKKPVYRKEFVREFYKLNGDKEEKHLVFSIKPVYFKKDYYLVVLIEDVTWVLKRFKPEKRMVEKVLQEY